MFDFSNPMSYYFKVTSKSTSKSLQSHFEAISKSKMIKKILISWGLSPPIIVSKGISARPSRSNTTPSPSQARGYSIARKTPWSKSSERNTSTNSKSIRPTPSMPMGSRLWKTKWPSKPNESNSYFRLYREEKDFLDSMQDKRLLSTASMNLAPGVFYYLCSSFSKVSSAGQKAFPLALIVA